MNVFKLNSLFFKNKIFYYFSIVLGAIVFFWYVYSRFIRERLPKIIPLELTEIWFYMLIYICCIYFYVVISLLFPRDQNVLLKKVIDKILHPMITFDTAWKTSYLMQPYYMSIMSNFISYLKAKGDIFKHFVFVLFQILPRAILVTVFSIDVYYFSKLSYVYKFILLGTLPLIHRYIKYSLKTYTSHLIIFANKNYETIYIINSVRSFMAEEQNPEAIFDGQRVTFEEYINIISENIQDIRNNRYKYISLDDDFGMIISEEKMFQDSDAEDYIPHLGIKYTGYGMGENEYVIKYAKRFFNKSIKDPLFDLTKNERKVLSDEFRKHYVKIFILQDIIPLYEEIINLPKYRYIRAGIYTIYFLLWSYLIIISYKNIPNFNLTEIILQWLTLYIPDNDPFSNTSISENGLKFNADPLNITSTTKDKG